MAMVTSNFCGAVFVFVIISFVLPVPEDVRGDGRVLGLNAVVMGAYSLVSSVVATTIGIRSAESIRRWQREERAPTEEERRFTLRYAMWSIRSPGTVWALGAVLASALNAPESGALALETGLTVMLGGVTTCAMAYLLAERIMRPSVAVALAGAPPREYAVPGVSTRTLLAWALGTGVPLLGIGVVALVQVVVGGISAGQLAATALVLALTGLLVGLAAMTAVARSVADPLGSMRSALARVEGGDLDAEVPVNDASEVGFLQAGFNRMVEGLRERERLGDLFGRHVGEDGARRALERGVELGGETREAAVLFVDIVGSTSYAENRDPSEVVGTLNDFFRVVVDAVRSHGGWINKFEGDAALCVFGAPLPQDDPAGCALKAAREIQARLEDEVSGIEAGIGVSAGRVVAGNVGAEDRFEYTVIGDPVNEAARLTELAKTRPGRLLASEAVVSRAEADEAGRWHLDEPVTLRGRSRPTRLAVPEQAAAATAR